MVGSGEYVSSYENLAEQETFVHHLEQRGVANGLDVDDEIHAVAH